MKRKFISIFDEFMLRPNTYIELYIVYPFMLRHDMIDFIRDNINVKSHSFKSTNINISTENNVI